MKTGINRRILSFFLVVLMTVSSISSAFAEEEAEYALLTAAEQQPVESPEDAFPDFTAEDQTAEPAFSEAEQDAPAAPELYEEAWQAPEEGGSEGAVSDVAGLTPILTDGISDEPAIKEQLQEVLPEENRSEAAEGISEDCHDAESEDLHDGLSDEDSEKKEADADKNENEDVEEEKPEETVAVRVVFASEKNPDMAVRVFLDGVQVECTGRGENGEWIFYLAPGEYTYSASSEGCIDAENSGLTVPEDMSELKVDVELEEKKSLPYGFAGMPEGYVLSDGEFEGKYSLAVNGTAGAVACLTPGVDYDDGTVIFLDSSYEHASLVAQAYCATLEAFEGGVAVIRLSEATVAQAVEVAANMELNMPPVEPNYITMLTNPAGEGMYSAKSFALQADSTPQTWRSWYDKTANPDTYLKNPSAGVSEYQYMHDMVNTYEAWGKTTGAGVRVVVIDTGVSGQEDLYPAQTSFFGSYGSGADENGHGTHVAGIIGARMGNGAGGAGIAPDAVIYSYRAGDGSGNFSSAAIIAGLQYAIDVGADIVNMSLGSYYYSSMLFRKTRDAVNAGITVVASIGNDGSNVKVYPAAFDMAGVISVGAVGKSGRRAYFSNFGDWLDVYAPGDSILSTAPGGGYVLKSGSSMAAPVVSGVCALYMSLNGHTGPAAMESIIKGSTSEGIVDAAKMLGIEQPKPAAVVRIENAPLSLVQGETAGLKAFDGDGMDVTRTVSWTIENNADFPGTIIDASGVITAGEEDRGQIIVRATGARGEYDEAVILIKAPLEVSAVTLNTNAAECFLHDDREETLVLVAMFTDDDGRVLSAEAVRHEWRSSDESVASVDRNGRVTVKGAGEARITCTAYKSDGSLETVCVVTVREPAAGIAVSGPDRIYQGKNGMFTAKAEPEGAYSGEISWSIPEGISGVTVNGAGIVTVGSTVPVNTVFHVRAALMDGSGVYGDSADVTVCGLATAVIAESPYENEAYKKTLGRNGSLSAVTLYTSDLQATAGINENAVTIRAFTDTLSADVSCALSGQDCVAMEMIEGTNTVRLAGRSAGRAVLTFTANDGSGKRATVNVTVMQSAESVYFTSETSEVVRGRSCTFRAAVSPANASNKKVEWSIAVPVEGVTVSSGGAVRVEGGVETGTVFTVRATAADGSGAYAEQNVRVLSGPVTAVSVSAPHADEGYSVSVNSKDAATAVTLYSSDIPETADRDESFITLVATTSGNPEAGVSCTGSKEGIVEIENVGGREYRIYGRMSGRTVLTFAATDGSGKRATVTVNVIVPVSAISIEEGFDRVSAGKTATVKAVVNPEATNRSVIWSVTGEEGPVDGVTIAKNTGRLTVGRDVPNKTVLLITATAADGSQVTATVRSVVTAPVSGVRIIAPNRETECITAAERSGSLSTASVSLMNCGEQGKLSLYAVTTGNDDTGVIWSSSNTAVASVAAEGKSAVLTMCAAGTARITAKAADSAGKSATFTLTVKNYVTSIDISGSDEAILGGMCSLKAEILPASASGARLRWTVKDGSGRTVSGVRISQTGELTVGRSVKTGTLLVVTASAPDGSGCTGTKSILVMENAPDTGAEGTPAASANSAYSGQSTVSGQVVISAPNGDSRIISVDSRNNVTELSLFAVSALNDNSFQLTSSIASTDVVWTSSNSAVASVDPTGRVTPHAPGNTIVKCTSPDGRESAPVMVRVVIPVSHVTVSSEAPEMVDSACNPVIFAPLGGSVRSYVTFGDAYGAPTVKKVAWRAELFRKSGQKYSSIANTDGKYFSISSDGVLSVNNAVSTITGFSLSRYEYIIRVYADALDGSGVSGYMDYCVQQPVSALKLDRTSLSLSVQNETQQAVEKIAVTSSAKNPFIYTVESENPNIAAATVSGVLDGKTTYIYVYPGRTAGTTRIRVSANDGSEITEYITVNVR